MNRRGSMGVMRPKPAGVGEMLAERSLVTAQQPQQKLAVSSPAAAKVSVDTPDFVLYFHPNCPVCRPLLQKLEHKSIPKVYVQNVLLLDNRPPWLNGVPILADTTLGMIYRGTDALIFLESLAKSRSSSLKDHKEVNTRLPPPPLKTPADIKSGMASLFEMDTDAEDDTDREKDSKQKKFSEDKISELMKRREQQVPQTKRIS